MSRSNRCLLDHYLASKSDTNESFLNFEDNLRRNQENLAALEKIQDIISIADEKIKGIISDTSLDKDKSCVHLTSPSYFENGFDHKSYIKKIVRAKLYGITIVQDDMPSKLLNKNKIQSTVIRNIDENYSFEPESLSAGLLPEKIKRGVTENTMGNRSDESNRGKCLSKNTKFLEITATHQEAKVNNSKNPNLIIQNLPGINIRSQLIEQKFPSVNIYPDDKDNFLSEKGKNVVVIQSKYSETNEQVNEEVQVEKVNEIGNDVQIEKLSTQPSSKIKIVKLADESTECKIIPEPASLETLDDLKFSTAKKYSQNEEKDTTFLFLNKSNISTNDSFHKCFRNKRISTLKKFGLPEIQKIYNPKPILNFKRGLYKHKGVNLNNLGYTTNTTFLNIPSSSQSGTNSFNLSNKRSNSKICESLEYIPYSKLTIGGIKIDDAEKLLSPKNSTPRKIETEMTQSNSKQIVNEKSNVDRNKLFCGTGDDLKEEIIKETSDVDIEGNITETDSIIKKSVENSNIKKNKKLKGKKTIMKVNFDQNKATQTDVKYIGDIAKDMINLNETGSMENIDTTENSIGDILELDNTHSECIETKLNLNNTETDIADGSRKKNKMKNEKIPKNTQTPLPKTVNVMTSPIKMINRELSPVFHTPKKSSFTSPIHFSDKEQTVDKKKDEKNSITKIIKTTLPTQPVYDSDAKCNSENESKTESLHQNLYKNNTSSDGYIDGSHSESSDVQSLGEINLRILRKKLVRILNDTNSLYSNSSITTSINSDIQLNSMLSSKKSDGEINLQYNVKKK